MIPVTLQAEPNNFEESVRKPGQKWLRDHNILLGGTASKASDLPAHWNNTSRELWDAYSGICGYLAIYFHWCLGAHSTEHYIPKSQDAWKAYEWDNYRLSSLGPNRKKNKFNDVIDPFTMPEALFGINFADGEMFVRTTVGTQAEQSLAVKTIQRLKLNESDVSRMRQDFFDQYVSGDISETYLKKHAPFVHAEIVRQGLL